MDISWLVYQGGWLHGDLARASDLLRWGTLGCWGCCSLVARTWSGHRVLSLWVCDSLILLGSGASDWSGHRALSLGMCDSLILLGRGTLDWFGYRVLFLGVCDSLILLGRGTLGCGGCWSLVIWNWSGHRIFSLGWCDSLLLLCKAIRCWQSSHGGSPGAWMCIGPG